jgi:hypothetical protein
MMMWELPGRNDTPPNAVNTNLQFFVRMEARPSLFLHIQFTHNRSIFTFKSFLSLTYLQNTKDNDLFNAT